MPSALPLTGPLSALYLGGGDGAARATGCSVPVTPWRDGTSEMRLDVVYAPLTLTVLMGCASGPIAGRLTEPGKPSKVVTLNYQSSVFGGSGKLWALLPDGQRYSGKYVLTPYAPDHHMVSTLEGDRGGTMTCRFKLNEPGVGPDKGGTGKCEVSQGGVIEATF